MNILFCSQNPLSRELGAPRVVLELADALRSLGWHCELAGPPEIVGAPDRGGGDYARALHGYLLKRAADFDVVDYDHQYLPFPRSEFPARTLFAARSVLLVHFRGKTPSAGITALPPAREKLAHARRPEGRVRQRTCTDQARATLRQADAVNLCNDDERALLVAEGVAPEKSP